MRKADETVQKPIVARVVHRSVLVDDAAGRRVIKLMFNLLPQDRRFEVGADIGFMASAGGDAGMRMYSISSGTATMLLIRFAWLRTTPFGSPVVPDV